jgi:uncharacterized caspase-like protein
MVASEVLVTLAFMAPWSLQVQDPNRSIVVTPGNRNPKVQEDRVALVIGNSAYPKAFLKNPLHDARSMKAALEGCGFEVTLLTNASKRKMEDAITAFGNRIRGGAVGLFYFAGHGLQVEGDNYLVPIEAKLDQEDDLPF